MSDIPLTIDRFGVNDVTEELNDFLDSEPAGSVVIAPPGARYRCEGVVQLMNKVDFHLCGNGATIFATTDGSSAAHPSDLNHLWPRKRTHVKINGGSNVHIDRLYVEGAHPNPGWDGDYVVAYEAQMGFEIWGVKGCTLTDCKAQRVYGDFLYISGFTGNWSEDVTVDGFCGRGTGRQGIAITAADRVTICNSFFDDVRRTIIDVEPNVAAGGGNNVSILYNRFGRQGLNWISSKGVGPNVTTFSVIGNRLYQTVPRVDMGVSTDRRGPFVFVGNMGLNHYGTSSGAAWEFTNIDGLRIEHNYQKLQEGRSMYLVGVRNCTQHDQVRWNTYPGGIGEKKGMT